MSVDISEDYFVLNMEQLMFCVVKNNHILKSTFRDIHLTELYIKNIVACFQVT